MPVLDNPRHERFAQELADGKSQTDAYVAAGYKESRSSASALATNPNISARVSELLSLRAQSTAKATERAVQKLTLDKEWVLTRLMENAERALQRQPVLGDDGEPIGEYKYEGNVANRALELLGKQLGLFIDRHEHGKPGEFEQLGDEELMQEIAKEAAELGLVLPESDTAH